MTECNPLVGSPDIHLTVVRAQNVKRRNPFKTACSDGNICFRRLQQNLSSHWLTPLILTSLFLYLSLCLSLSAIVSDFWFAPSLERLRFNTEEESAENEWLRLKLQVTFPDISCLVCTFWFHYAKNCCWLPMKAICEEMEETCKKIFVLAQRGSSNRKWMGVCGLCLYTYLMACKR